MPLGSPVRAAAVNVYTVPGVAPSGRCVTERHPSRPSLIPCSPCNAERSRSTPTRSGWSTTTSTPVANGAPVAETLLRVRARPSGALGRGEAAAGRGGGAEAGSGAGGGAGGVRPPRCTGAAVAAGTLLGQPRRVQCERRGHKRKHVDIAPRGPDPCGRRPHPYWCVQVARLRFR